MLNWAGRPSLTLHRALRRIFAGLVFLLVFWVLAGACQRHGERGFLLRNTTITTAIRSCLLVVRACVERSTPKQSGDPYVFGLSALSQASDYFFVRERESDFSAFFFARKREKFFWCFSVFIGVFVLFEVRFCAFWGCFFSSFFAH